MSHVEFLAVNYFRGLKKERKCKYQFEEDFKQQQNQTRGCMVYGGLEKYGFLMYRYLQTNNGWEV